MDRKKKDFILQLYQKHSAKGTSSLYKEKPQCKNLIQFRFLDKDTISNWVDIQGPFGY